MHLRARTVHMTDAITGHERALPHLHRPSYDAYKTGRLLAGLSSL